MNRYHCLALLLLAAIYICTGIAPAEETKGAENTTQKAGLSGEVFILTSDDTIHTGTLEPMDKGFYVLRMQDRILRIAPQFLTGIFATRQDALNAKTLIRGLLESEATDNGTAPENTDRIAGDTGRPSAEDRKELRQLTLTALNKSREIMQKGTQGIEVKNISEDLKSALKDPRELLKPKNAENLFILSSIKLPPGKIKDFEFSLDKLENKINKLEIDQASKSKLQAIVTHARRMHKVRINQGQFLNNR